jgi:hypothetical protein
MQPGSIKLAKAIPIASLDDAIPIQQLSYHPMLGIWTVSAVSKITAAIRLGIRLLI